jgi:hypothetical protein
LWNGRDPILKERLYGLTNSEGNHGEDVKELYYYLDATPSHSYLKMLYKYPQGEFPYQRLIDESRRRGTDQPEFELLDSGLFDEDRYFDVFVEYAKATPDDILMLVTVHNRGPETAKLALLPQLCFRNTWSWRRNGHTHRLSANSGGVKIEHEVLGPYRLDCDGKPALLFCQNDTNPRRHYGQPDAKGFFKDAFHEYLIAGNQAAVNPDSSGTKAGALYDLNVRARQSVTVRLRMAKSDSGSMGEPWADFDAVLAQRRIEADAFYADLQQTLGEADARLVQRQAFGLNPTVVSPGAIWMG